MVATDQEMVREKILQGQEKVREFFFFLESEKYFQEKSGKIEII